jgi:hypothetical protein
MTTERGNTAETENNAERRETDEYLMEGRLQGLPEEWGEQEILLHARCRKCGGALCGAKSDRLARPLLTGTDSEATCPECVTYLMELSGGAAF